MNIWVSLIILRRTSYLCLDAPVILALFICGHGETAFASLSWVCYRINAVMHEQSRYRHARMTRKKNTPLYYEPHSVGGVRSDRTGGIETRRQHPVYDIPEWLAAWRATRTRGGITLRHAAKRLGMLPSEFSGIERGEFQTTPDEVRRFTTILGG